MPARFVWRPLAIQGAPTGDPLAGLSLDGICVFGNHVLMTSGSSAVEVLLEAQYTEEGAVPMRRRSTSAILAFMDARKRSAKRAKLDVEESTESANNMLGGMDEQSVDGGKMLLQLQPEEELEYLTKLHHDKENATSSYGEDLEEDHPARHLDMIRDLAGMGTNVSRRQDRLRKRRRSLSGEDFAVAEDEGDVEVIDLVTAGTSQGLAAAQTEERAAGLPPLEAGILAPFRLGKAGNGIVELGSEVLSFHLQQLDRRYLGRIRHLSTIGINLNDARGTSENWYPGFVAATGFGAQHSYLNCVHSEVPTEVRASFQLPGDVRSDIWTLPSFGMTRKQSRSAKTAATENDSINSGLPVISPTEAKYLAISTESGKNLVLDLNSDDNIREVSNSFLTEKSLLFLGGCARSSVYWALTQSGDIHIVDPDSLQPLISTSVRDVCAPDLDSSHSFAEAQVSTNSDGGHLMVLDNASRRLFVVELDFDQMSRSGAVRCVLDSRDELYADIALGDVLACAFYRREFIVAVTEDRKGRKVRVFELMALSSGDRAFPRRGRRSVGGTKATRQKRPSRSASPSESREENAAVREVFASWNLDLSACVLRNSKRKGAAIASDRLRCLSSPTAEVVDDKGVGSAGAKSDIFSVELVDMNLASGDCGPTLFLLQEGRPILVYRSFFSEEEDEAAAHFPFSFRLIQHRYTSQIRQRTKPRLRKFAYDGGYCVCVDRWCRQNGPVFFFADGNRFFAHLGRKELLCTQPFYSRTLFEEGEEFCFFSLVKKQLRVPRLVDGGDFTFGAQEEGDLETVNVWEGQIHMLNNAVNFFSPVLRTEFALPNAPTAASVDPASKLCAIATAEAVVEQKVIDLDPAAAEEDDAPLPPIVDGEQEVKVAAAVETVEDDMDEDAVKEEEGTAKRVVPRRGHQYELQVCTLQDPSELNNAAVLPLNFSYSLDPRESVMCMEWCKFRQFSESVLCVGTGINLGEDTVCRGRVLLFLAKDPTKPGGDSGTEAGDTSGSELVPTPGSLLSSETTAEPFFSKRVKGPIMCMQAVGRELLAYTCGNRFCLHRWDSQNSSLQLLAFHESGFCITSMSIVKSAYILLGDAHNGMDLLRWFEAPGGMMKPVKRLERLARSASSSHSLVSVVNKERRVGSENVGSQVPVLGCNFILEQNTLGLVATDIYGNVHLSQYLPHMIDSKEGDRVLRTAASFHLGTPARAIERMERVHKGKRFGGVFLGGADGSFFALNALTDTKFRILNTLCAHLAQRLPFVAGCSPLAKRCPEHFHGHYRKNIEDGSLLNLFLFLSWPLQSAIADRIQIPLEKLVKHVEEACSCEPF
ncbi:unnamed protein product [Amoebophrya sp. A25]|nr:unnamed protein product [Amoebophrya sp. A25]|eukprot:GSA25T00024718001.1